MIQMLVCDKLSMNLFFTNSLRHTAHLAFPSVLAVNVWSPALPFGATGLCQQSLHFQHAFIWCTKISSQTTFCRCLSKSHIWQGFMCVVLHPHDTYFTIIIFIQAGLLGFFNYKNPSIHHQFPINVQRWPPKQCTCTFWVFTCISFGAYMYFVRLFGAYMYFVWSVHGLCLCPHLMRSAHVFYEVR